MRSGKSRFPSNQRQSPAVTNLLSVIALSKLYSLNDSRVAQTNVKGDLIVPTSDRIMTRSRAKLSMWYIAKVIGSVSG
jgi:hypothetical protein